MNDAEAAVRLEASISGLADAAPEVSARNLLTKVQRNTLLGALLVVVLAFTVFPLVMFQLLVGIVTLLYAVCIVYRAVLFRWSIDPDSVEYVSDDEASAVEDADLPTYTILIPAYKEPEVIDLVMGSIGRLIYPVDKLDIKMMIEADDHETLAAVQSANPGPQFELVEVPPAEPRTKPKALNFGLPLARGELLAIYDAEDEPDPLQLRRAAVALSRLGPEVGCVQSKLAFHNVDQNLITRWFSIDYAMWFSYFLPGLASVRAPIPLGGTSNHFRVSILRAMGGWDPFNVTEDADLGIRMDREGYTVRVLESVTLEEANSDFVNWEKQRSRWYKGYLQTFLIHMRSPRKLRQELGWKGLFHFCVFVGGTPILAFLNPLFWLMTMVWFVAHPAFIKALFPAPIYYLGLVCWLFGNFLLIYLTLLAVRSVGRPNLLFAALLVPLYWVMMAIAAVKAFVQLIFTPTFWEKTAHGLDASGGAPSDGLTSHR